MKTIKKNKLLVLILIILALLLFRVSSANAQENQELFVKQDFRLLFFDDSINRNGPNLDVIAGIQLNQTQRDFGYWAWGSGFEFATLPESNLFRMFISTGYVINSWNWSWLETYAGFEVGIITRYSLGFWSFSGIGELRIKISDKWKLSLGGRVMPRPDIYERWGTKKVEYAGFFGFIYELDLD